jgi:hypothetical protein
MIKQVPTGSAVVLVLISCDWRGRRTLKSKGGFPSRELAELEKTRLMSYGAQFMNCPPKYRVCGPVQLKKLVAEVEAEQAERRKAGAKKAASKPKKFILCPTCGCKSKKLYSEMGGLETRECKNGHLFESDHKWNIPARRIENADRGFFVGPALRYGRFR